MNCLYGDTFVMFQIKFLPTEKSHLEAPLEENVNRIIPDEGTVEARTIEDAIAVLRYHMLTVCTVCVTPSYPLVTLVLT